MIAQRQKARSHPAESPALPPSSPPAIHDATSRRNDSAAASTCAIALGARRRRRRQNSTATHVASGPKAAFYEPANASVDENSDVGDVSAIVERQQTHSLPLAASGAAHDDEASPGNVTAPRVIQVPMVGNRSSPEQIDEPPDDESQECIICWDAKRTHACVPCGHRCLCAAESCRHDLAVCPLCRAEVTGFIRVWD